MTDIKHKATPAPKQAKGGGKIILIGIAILLLIGFLFGDKSGDQSGQSEQSTQKSTPIITISDLKDGIISTTEKQYKLSVTVTKSGYDLQDVKMKLNDKESMIMKDPSDSSGTKYTAVPSLKNGKNTVVIHVDAHDIGETLSTIATKKFDIDLQSSEAPVIKIDNATQQDASWKVDNFTKDKFELTVHTTPENSTNSGASTVIVNDEQLALNEPGGILRKHELALKDGVNDFTIVAKNNSGEAVAHLSIVKLSNEEQIARQKTESILSEAEVSCKQYAQKVFLVKDINIGYNQSSLRKQNPDGTLLIKANIADSQGFFRQQKPLGIMECTTDPTGYTVLDFVHY